jgi:hypothetical protein
MASSEDYDNYNISTKKQSFLFGLPNLFTITLVVKIKSLYTILSKENLTLRMKIGSH